MHIGNARIAVVNYLFARQNNGELIFRIDDTDRERSKKEYEDSIINDLSWLQITYAKVLRQSARTSRYDDIKGNLMSRGTLYRCYESQEELECKRRMATLKGAPPAYDRAALQLSDSQIAKLEESGRTPYLRFKLPNEVVTWDDVILGRITYDLSNISDPVICKADGAYLYSFSSVIDDIDCGITHIIRGQDHVTNTAVQIAMFNEISGGAYSCDFAHLSLLTNKDGSQFSKRVGGMNLGDFRSAGIDPMAISSILATLGTSLDTKPFLDMNELIRYFDITKFGSNSPKFDSRDVWKLNKKIMQLKRYADVKDYISSESVFEIAKDNIETYNDLRMWDQIFTNSYNPSYAPSESEAAVLNAALGVLRSCDSNITWPEFWKTVAEKANASGRNLYVPLRMATTGMDHGPNLTDLFATLGAENVRIRVGAALDLFLSQQKQK
jgi:glutamyl-tRNA synthetase